MRWFPWCYIFAIQITSITPPSFQWANALFFLQDHWSDQALEGSPGQAELGFTKSCQVIWGLLLKMKQDHTIFRLLLNGSGEGFSIHHFLCSMSNFNKIWAGKEEHLSNCKHHFLCNTPKFNKIWAGKGENLSNGKHHFLCNTPKFNKIWAGKGEI